MKRTYTIEGKPVENATAPLNLHISPNDVRKGVSSDPDACAAAVAALRLTGVKKAKVYLSTTYLLKGARWIRYRTPERISREIVAFDRGAAFTLGDYKINPIQPSHRARGERMGGDDKPRKPIDPTRAPRPYVETENVRERAPTRAT